MTDYELIPYVPEGPKRLVSSLAPRFLVRDGASDVKAIEACWSKGDYRRPSVGFEPEPGETWLDAGANVGGFSVLAGLMGAKVVAVEAERRNVSMLRSNLDLNGLTDALALQLAVVADSYGKPTIELQVEDKPNRLRRHSILDREGVAAWGDANRPTRIELVDAIRMTDLVEKFRPDGIKLNVEGAEIPILQEWRPPSFVKRFVCEWSFDVDPRISTLARAVELLRAGFGNVHVRSKINWQAERWTHYPPNTHIYAWR